MSWELKRIGEVFKISSGGTPSRDNPHYYSTAEIPWIKTGDLKNTEIYAPSEYISEEGLKNSSAKKFPVNTVLIAMYGATIGACSILKIEAATNQACAALLPTEEVNERYTYYYLRSIKSKIIELGVGGAQPNISAGILKSIQIPLPPLETQKKIAEILDTADTLRQKDKALIEKYNQLTQSLFLEMFGDPVRNEKGWDKKMFGQVINSIRYGTSTPPIYQKEGIPFLRATNIKNGRIEEKGMVFLSEEEALKIKKCRIREGDLLIVRSGANTGDCARIDEKYHNCLAGYDLIVEIENPYSFFYNYFLNTAFGRAILKPLSRRAGQPHLNAEQIKTLELIFPPLDEQNKFMLLNREIEKQRQLAEENLVKSDALFNSLLQNAFKND